MTTHIVTMGGGGFSMSDNNAPTNLDRYLLELTGRRSPLVCFVPTASADDPTYVRKFLSGYASLGVRTMVLTLWQDAKASLARLPQADLVLVGAGSTVNLLALWRAHGVDRVLAEMMNRDQDLVLGGLSAGAACWYSGCVTDSFGDLRAWPDGLRMLPHSFCPHWDGERGRQPIFTEAIASGMLADGYAADDGAAVHWVNGVFSGAVAEREGARVARFTASDEPGAGGLSIEQLPVELL
ncbi:peptidase E [Propionimicrobium sp. PCR01-08-3]|uniref:Type 1 glutamine amidotransferase-like domain-containing protein n=1 Tax=Propionimicrobium sp. PCR01-08-3 TaxID=3052086 RepID=UPI00255CD5AA|nr:peptidase E [Propionimicrobium sp. PCR01-08-3]WIY83311.1 peptidase E [Propionimicrobium sp. PCR01-08-3]